MGLVPLIICPHERGPSGGGPPKGTPKRSLRGTPGGHYTLQGGSGAAFRAPARRSGGVFFRGPLFDAVRVRLGGQNEEGLHLPGSPFPLQPPCL